MGCHSAPAAYNTSSNCLTVAWGQERKFYFWAKFLFQSLHLLFPSTASFCYLISTYFFPLLLFMCSTYSCLLLAAGFGASQLLLTAFVVCLCMPGSLCPLLTWWISHSNSPKENLSKAASPCPYSRSFLWKALVLGTLRTPSQLTDDRDLCLVQSTVTSVTTTYNTKMVTYMKGNLQKREWSGFSTWISQKRSVRSAGIECLLKNSSIPKSMTSKFWQRQRWG